MRDAVGVFDVSHLGKATRARSGRGRRSSNACLTNDLGRIGPGRRSTRCAATESGGVVDDLIAYLRQRRGGLPRPERREHRRGRAPPGRPRRRTASRSTGQHRDFGVLAVQGPRSARGARPRSACPTDHDYMAYVDADLGRPAGAHLPHAATPASTATSCSPALGRRRPRCGTRSSRRPRELGGMPAGLGARDTLRTEMGYPLHGQDLSLEISPVQARAGWAVGWKKDAFWGRDALLAETGGRPGAPAARPRVARPGHPAGPHGGARRRRQPDRRGHQRDVLAHPAQGHRAGADRHRRRREDGDELAVDVRGRRSAVRVRQAAVRRARTCADSSRSTAGDTALHAGSTGLRLVG